MKVKRNRILAGFIDFLDALDFRFKKDSQEVTKMHSTIFTLNPVPLVSSNINGRSRLRPNYIQLPDLKISCFLQNFYAHNGLI